MADADFFGWQMLWKLEKSNIVTKSDVMVLFMHWFLANRGFLNVGVGEDKTLDNSVEQSELLPDGWNCNHTSYALRYAKNGELYVLHGTLSNETMIFNLLQVKTLQVSNVAFDLDATIRSVQGDKLQDLFADVKTQHYRLRSELMQPIYDEESKSIAIQTTPMLPEPSRPPNPYLQELDVQPDVAAIAQRNLADLRNVGRADLDPLGRFPYGNGGGMLMDPNRHRPPGYLPIRFDPIHGPAGNRNIRQFPDPDHLPPPGYDDMFM